MLRAAFEWSQSNWQLCVRSSAAASLASRDAHRLAKQSQDVGLLRASMLRALDEVEESLASQLIVRCSAQWCCGASPSDVRCAVQAGKIELAEHVRTAKALIAGCKAASGAPVQSPKPAGGHGRGVPHLARC